MIINCYFCKKPFHILPCRIKRAIHNFCSCKCSSDYKKTRPKEYTFSPPPILKGDKNYRWNNGSTLDRYGYKMILLPDYPKSNSKGYYPEHRYVMEQHLGRYLEKTELIHHINHDKLDNSIENLMIVSRKDHPKIHPPTPK